jgi:hypothetical protein
MRKATHLDEIDQALRLNEPIGPDHEFYTDFSGMRGEFEEKIVYKALNVKSLDNKFVFNYKANAGNKTLLFLGGMRGTGKTSELLRYEKNLHRPECLFVVFCRLDEDLNLNDLEYMDILILQLEKLTDKLKSENITVDTGTVESLYKWFDQQTKEVRGNTKLEGQVGAGIGAKKEGLLASLLGLFAELKFSVTAGTERTTSLRRVLKNNFTHFSHRVNEFIEVATRAVRDAGKGQDILFIIDGLEKTLTADTRRKIVIDEANKIRQIKANMLFVLPIELMKERPFLRQLTEFVTAFPNIKIQDREENDQPDSFQRLLEFIYKRVDQNLFADNENDALVKKIIRYSGGNPRELLRVLSYANFFADEQLGKINREALDKGLKKLANETVEYLTQPEFDKLKELYKNNKAKLQTPYDKTIDTLIENVIVYEYNDGTFKRANPVIELADIYQQRVIKSE